jgi:hypothetical protein
MHQRIKIISLCVAALLASAGAFLFVAQKWNVEPPVASVPREATSTTGSTQRAAAGSREYRNERYHFSFLYPEDLDVHVFDQEGGVEVITFEDKAVVSLVGFQILVVPYKDERISDEQFRRDLPSGVRTDVSNVTIDGVAGTAFYSVDASLGDTREVWFTHDGFLYEVTTYKALDEWLREILTTWQFI